MFKRKKSFFNRITGGLSLKDMNDDLMDDFDDLDELKDDETSGEVVNLHTETDEEEWPVEDEVEEMGELPVDMYQTDDEIVVKAMVAGVKPGDLDVDITRDSIVIIGHRKEGRKAEEGNYFVQELYWGSFTKEILLPEEVNPEEAMATEKHGLLVIRLPKIDKKQKTKLKVKSR